MHVGFQGELFVTESVFVDNSVSDGSGGAISSVGALKLSFTGSDLLQNRALENGGAIAVDASTIEVGVSGGTLAQNMVGGSGGAVYFETENWVLGGAAVVRHNSAGVGSNRQLERLFRTHTLQ